MARHDQSTPALSLGQARALICAAAVCVAPLPASALVLWDEAVNGDLTNGGSSAGTFVGNLVSGMNEVKGRMTYDGDFSTSDDDDFKFTLASGMTITDIRLVYTASANAELASNDGWRQTWLLFNVPTVPAFASRELVLTGNGTTTPNGSVVSGTANFFQASLPLGPATYQIAASGTGYTNLSPNSQSLPAIIDYNFQITVGSEAVAPVPEPSTYALFAFGLIAVGWAVRSRRKFD